MTEYPDKKKLLDDIKKVIAPNLQTERYNWFAHTFDLIYTEGKIAGGEETYKLFTDKKHG